LYEYKSNKRHFPEKYRYFIGSIWCGKHRRFFGSVSRGEEGKKSDIDILVEFSKPLGFFKFIELEIFLSKLIGKKVDLVTKKALKSVIEDEILREVSYV